MYFNLEEGKFSAYLSLSKNFNKRTSLKAGLNTDYWLFNYLDSFRLILIPAEYPGGDTTAYVGNWRLRWDARSEGAIMVQPYIQLRHHLGKRFTAMAGLTSLYFGLNDNSFSPVEPRLGLVYDMGKNHNQKISLGYGLHTQIIPPYLYFYGVTTANGDPQELNKGLGMFKSHHGVLGYDWYFSKTLRLKLEAYYQHLFDIPVDKGPSSFSLVNTGSGFDRLFPKELVNEGTGGITGLKRLWNGPLALRAFTSCSPDRYSTASTKAATVSSGIRPSTDDLR